jgi:predicted membrane protein
VETEALLEIILCIAVVILYIVVIGFYVWLLWLTKRKSEKLTKKSYHYICNLISLVIMITTLMTPLNQILGYTLASIILIIELTISKHQSKSSN